VVRKLEARKIRRQSLAAPEAAEPRQVVVKYAIPQIMEHHSRLAAKGAVMRGKRPVSYLVLRSICAIVLLGSAHAVMPQHRQLVEEITVVGNRRLSKEEILKHIATRVGDVFVQEKVNRDFGELLALGLFYKEKSRVLSENGARGGLVLTFELFELPLIQQVEFSGLPANLPLAELREALKTKTKVDKDEVFDRARCIMAKRLVAEYLESHGLRNAQVDVVFERLETDKVIVKFEISARY
jgi:outer membrane protein assembly factor BamA